jgi:hypothetical protein
MGENHFTQTPTMLSGVNLLSCAPAYFTLQLCIVAHHGKDSHFALALGRDVKGKLSLALCALGIVAPRQSHRGAGSLSSPLSP